jgi:histidinol-phosphatase (PHP family)
MPVAFPPDLHVHTGLSIDAKGTQLQCVDAGAKAGLPGIGFSEHWDFDPKDTSTGRFNYMGQRESLVALVDLCLGESTVFFGAEISYQEIYEAEIRESLKSKQFDFLIGSLHHIADELIEDFASKFAGKPAREVYGAYFNEYLAMVESRLFDIAGHLDYPKRYGCGIFGPFNYADYKGIIDKIINSIVGNGMVMEVNTKGWRSSAGEQYPSTDILVEYKKRGGAYVTLGSDAHHPSEVGCDFARAMELIKGIGLKPVAFASRELHPWPMD